MPARALGLILWLLVSTNCAICQQESGISPREQLQQYVADLQKNPSDDALREKIIKLALTLDPKPKVPDDAAIAAAKGKGIFGSATSREDAKAAAAAFTQASTLAPWVPEYYYNEGSALEKAGQFDDAVRALKFYLMSDPKASDANDVRGKIEAIQYEKDKAARQQKQQAAEEAAKQRQFVESLAGNWKASSPGGGYDAWSLSSDFPNVEIQWTGYHAADGSFSGDRSHKLLGTISGQRIYGNWDYSFDVPRGWPCAGGTYKTKGTFAGTVSQDGQRISITESGYQLDIGACQWKQSDKQLVFERQ